MDTLRQLLQNRDNDSTPPMRAVWWLYNALWIARDLACCLSQWGRYFENSCRILVLFSVSVWEELLYSHALVSQAMCFLLWMLASVIESLWWGLAALKLESLPDSAWHMPWHYWCPFTLKSVLAFQWSWEERGRRGCSPPVSSEPTSLVTHHQSRTLSSRHAWAGLSRQGEDLVNRNEKSRHGSQKAPELFRKFKVRHKQASYRHSFSTEKFFLWSSP